MGAVTPGFVQTMAAYNGEMNRRLYGAAGRLPDAARRMERGAFWGSIHGTLSHLLWGDQIWMWRFDGWDKPPVAMDGSPAMVDDFAELQAARTAIDARLAAWAGQVQQGWLDGEQTWFSGSAGREMTRGRDILVMHFFNHQTHHRGQVHTMLTAAGEKTGDTDLPWVI